MYKKLKMVMLTVFAAGGFAVLGAATAYTTMTKIHLFNSLIDSTPIGQTLAAAVNTTGLSVNGSAPNQHVLCGNGSVYGDCGGVTGLSLNNSTITGGTISGASITNSPISGNAGSFTTLQLNNAGPSNHVLVGNGTSYVDSTTITSVTINSSTLNGATIATPTITNPAITGGTIGSATLNGNVITAGTMSNVIIGNSSISGGAGDFTSLKLNGTAANGNVLVGNGTSFVSGPIPSAGASSFATPNGYATMPGGLIIEWVQGSMQSDAGGSGNAAQTLTFPLAFPHAFLGASCAAYTTGEASGNDTFPSTQQPRSWNTTLITVQRYRLADHGSDPSAPMCTIFGN